MGRFPIKQIRLACSHLAVLLLLMGSSGAVAWASNNAEIATASASTASASSKAQQQKSLAAQPGKSQAKAASSKTATPQRSKNEKALKPLQEVEASEAIGFDGTALADEEETPTPVLFNLQIKHPQAGLQLEEGMEVLSWSDGSFSYPIKYVAELLENDPQLMPSSGAVTFYDSGRKQFVSVDVQKQRITVTENQDPSLPKAFAFALVADDEQSPTEPDPALLPLKHPLTQAKDGYISPNDVYVDQATLERLLGVKLSTTPGEQTVTLVTTKTLKVSLRNSPGGLSANGQQSAANAKLVLPQAPGTSLDRIGVDFNSTRFQQRQVTPLFSDAAPQSTQWVNTGASLRTGFSGFLFGMPYSVTPRVSLTPNAQAQGKGLGSIRLSDLQWNISKSFEKSQAMLGSLNLGLSPLVAPNISIWGVQWASNNAQNLLLKPTQKHSFIGKATGNEPVSLQVNGQTRMVQPISSTQHYRFEDVAVDSQQSQQVRVLQGNVVLEEVTLAPQNSGGLSKGQSAFSTFAGHIAPQFQGIGKDWILPHSNKWLVGSRYFYGLSDHWTAGVSTAADTILGRPQTSPLSLVLSQLNSPDLSGYTSFRRDPNLVSGKTVGFSLTYNPNQHLAFNGDLAGSQLHSFLPGNSGEHGQAGDWAGQLSAQIQNARSNAQVKLFHYGTHFYSPATSLNSTLYDRKGVSLNTQTIWKGVSAQAHVERYNTNLSGIIAGGAVAVTHWDATVSRALGQHASLRLSSSRLLGENAQRKLSSENDEVDLNLNLPYQAQGQLSLIRANTQQLVSLSDPSLGLGVQNTKTLNNTLRASLQSPLPKRVGFFQGSVSLSPVMNITNMLLSLHWKKLSVEPAVQMSFLSENSLAVLGMGVYYQQDNGQRIGLRYTYSQASNSLASYYGTQGNSALFSGATIGHNQQKSHQLQVDFNGGWSLMQNRRFPFTPARRDESDTGLLEGVVFMDLNRNGLRDAHEPGLKDLPVLMNQNATFTSGKRGDFNKSSMSPGLYTISLDLEKLPISLTPTSPAVNAVIEKGKRTKVMLGVICTPGTLSGTVQRRTIRKEQLSSSDIMVALLDITGKTIQYTYTDEAGNYTLNNVPPGHYQLAIDSKQVNQSRYEVLSQPTKVEVPLIISDSYIREQLNFDLLQRQ